jgi:ribose transport system permease protein
MNTAKSLPQKQNAIDWDVLWERYGITAVLVIAWIVAYFLVPKFSLPDNMLNVLRQSAFVGVAAVGMTVAIISGTFDLSIGSTLGFCGWTAVVVGAATGSVPLAILSAAGVGVIVGIINGILITRIKIPAFITTLGMYFIVRAIHFILTDGASSRYSAKDFVWWGNGSVLGIPVPFIIFIVMAVLIALVLNRTAFGRYVYSIGTNIQAAKVAGVPVQATTMWIFIVVSLFCSFSGFLIGSRIYSAGPGLEPDFALNVIATVVLGGTRLAGGRGSMLGTVAAAILFAGMSNVLNLMHTDSFVQRVAVGLVLLLALSIEGIRQRLFEISSRKTSKEVKVEKSSVSNAS